MAKIYDGFLPTDCKNGKLGYYPVTTADEWNELPCVYKAMEWFPVDDHTDRYHDGAKTVAEYVEFDTAYMEPYKCRAIIRVHVQDVQKILFCLFKNPQCHLYSICGVVFQNGERVAAKWRQDATTGAFAVYTIGGTLIGKQGGFMGFIPNQIERDGNGFKWVGYSDGWKNRCHYELSNPFESR